MCLLVTQPEGVSFSEEFLRGVYDYNSDGIGMMYADNNSLWHAKFVPNTFEQYLTFYKEHIEGRKCAWHSRLQTHGKTDLANAHPYEVISADEGYPLYLCHNGILPTGNKADITKSDTWHFIQNFLRPMLLKNPEFFMDPAFEVLIGDFIGRNNKFVLLDAYGNQVTINEDEFVEYNGAKLSNTYAWDTTGTEYDYKSTWKNTYKSSLAQYDNYGNYGHNNVAPLTHNKRATSRIVNGDREVLDYVAGPWDVALGDAVEELEDKLAAQQAYESERDEFVEFAFEELTNCGLNTAYRTLSYVDMEKFYDRAGEKEAYAAVDLIQYGSWTDQDFIDLVRDQSAVA